MRCVHLILWLKAKGRMVHNEKYFNTEGYKKLIIDDILFKEVEIIYEEGRKIILQK